MKISCLLGICLLSFCTAVDASLVYTYSGNNFDTITDNDPPSGTNYSDSQSVTVTFTTPSLLVNLNEETIVPTSFTISDGVTSFTETSALDYVAFTLTTNASGNITYWDINTNEKNYSTPSWTVNEQAHQLITAHTQNVTRDISSLNECISIRIDSTCDSVSIDRGEVNNNPGQWNTNTVIPVPAAFWLFGSGLLGLIGIARRKKAF
jgi:hypothetical protein